MSVNTRAHPALREAGRPLYLALLPHVDSTWSALHDPLLKYGRLKSSHPQQGQRASIMFMSTTASAFTCKPPIPCETRTRASIPKLCENWR